MNAPLDRDLETLERLAREILDAAREQDLEAVDERLGLRRPLLDRLARVVAVSAEHGEGATRVRERLAAILDVDRESERLLDAGRAELEAKLGEIAQGRRGLRGYAGRSPGATRVDERG